MTQEMRENSNVSLVQPRVVAPPESLNAPSGGFLACVKSRQAIHQTCSDRGVIDIGLPGDVYAFAVNQDGFG